MELCVNDKITAGPSAGDIVGALDAAPFPEGWYIMLESDDSLIEAEPWADGGFTVSASDRGRELTANAPIDAGRLKEVLLKLLAGDESWRTAGFWVEDKSQPAEPGPSAGKRGPAPPTWALVTIVGVIGAAVLAGTTHDRWSHGVPFARTGWFWVALIAGPIVVLLGVAFVARMVEVRRAARWTMTMGRIVRSETEAHRHRFSGQETQVTTVPVVEFEFSVAGRKFRGNRISIGDDSGGENLAATLERYPVGAIVGVHYDPANPLNSVLERDAPDGVGKGLLVLMALVVGLAAGGYWLATSGPGAAAEYLPNARAHPGVVIFATVFGLFLLLLFRASLKSTRETATWPVVRGTVTESTIERIEKTKRGGIQVTWTPAVEYRYRVGDVDYTSRQIKLGVVVSASQGYARKVAARYPQGSTVEVRYDPNNPGSAALENPGGWSWLILAIALACFGGAAYAGGLV
jgi:hypothetical protein